MRRLHRASGTKKGTEGRDVDEGGERRRRREKERRRSASAAGFKARSAATLGRGKGKGEEDGGISSDVLLIDEFLSH